MAEHLRWGILGAANFAKQFMGPAIHAARGGALTALATSSGEKAAPFLDFAPGLRVFDSYDALLADPEIDAVYIPLPNALHVEWCKRAAKAGKHVLCEKPIAMKAAEIDELIALRDSSGKLIAEAWMIAHHPQFAKARELLQEGAIGNLVRVDSTHSFYNADLDNIRNKPETGGGALGDIGIYAFGSIRLLTGQEPEALLSTVVDWENGIDTAAHITARFPGFIYSGRVSMRAAPWQEIVLHGDKGLMRLPVPFNVQVFGEARLELHGPGLEVKTWRWPAENHYVLQVENFNDAVRGRSDYPLPLEFCRGTQAWIDDILAAGG
ncbi:Gfo/Idh/MocA family protein [Salipiger mucosus]|uniref:Oxidoreductase, Gfo/Idh/MocA family n=1 Tax=Salipiger mucosus DSM 16094 TaxID=1123237 RepID=S9Q8G7_9RHOB|nr:Gfo/Idh/MocA family oxidoreductase [Salipiger mucosus]EPX75923.1 Oxidoreductase, Gfo/Idh/MocA family [Salipiger mucosus DSM 16094]